MLGVAVVVFVAGCGGGNAANDRSVAADPSASSAPPPAPPQAITVSSPRPAGPSRPVHIRPLTPVERGQLRMLASSIREAVGRYDSSTANCGAASWASCVDAAWAILVGDLDWPPYYLRLLGDRRNLQVVGVRGDCEPLADGIKAVYSFNLGARQLDYADPDVDASQRRSGYPSLVDGLRPVPSELLAAATSGCR
jgi:hypothetical protein